MIFKRSSGAYSVNSRGYLVAVGKDIPRYPHDPTRTRNLPKDKDYEDAPDEELMLDDFSFRV